MIEARGRTKRFGPGRSSSRAHVAGAGTALLFANATAQRYPDFDVGEQRSFDPTNTSLDDWSVSSWIRRAVEHELDRPA